MYKFGLIGYPVSHSLSEVIHIAAMKSVGVTGSYDLLATPAEDLVDRIKYLKVHDYNGFNVTIPLKVPVAMFLNDVDKIADIAGAVNTVKIMPDKTLKGFNTDISGFVNAIDTKIKFELQGKKAVILGTGGAARACTIGLAQIGIGTIDFYSRNIPNSTDMVNFLRKSFPDVELSIKHYSTMKDFSDVNILVNTTPIGMKNFAMNESLVYDEQIATLPCNALVYDIIYTPFETLLIKLAKKYHLKTISGLDMLIHQAYSSFEIWTGKSPNFDKMKIAALEKMLMS